MEREIKTVKYIFFVIVMFLLAVASYIIFGNNKKIAIEIKNNHKEENIKNSISIGITNLDTLNPLLTKNKDVSYILKLVYKPILDISKDFKLEPSLANEYSKIDSKTYIVKLNDNIFWQDGKKFNAQDVVFTINAIKKVWQDSIYYNNVKDIQEILIIDEYTLKISLSKEVPFFEYKLVLPILPINQYNEEYELKVNIPCGTGDYAFKVISDNKITLFNGKAKTSVINIINYERNQDMYSDFTKQKLDLITTSNTEYEKYIGEIGYKGNIIQDRNFFYILLNLDNKLLKNNVVRASVNEAINRKEIINKVYKGKLLEMNFPKNNYLESKNYNPNNAEQLLINDGWSHKNNCWYKDGIKLTLTLSINGESENNIKAAEIIKQQLEELGITTEVIMLNKSNYEFNLENNDYDLILTESILCLEPDYTKYFKSESANTILYEISQIENEKIRENKIDALINLNNETVQFIGLYVDTTILLLNKNLKGDFAANWYNIFYNIDTWYSLN